MSNNSKVKYKPFFITKSKSDNNVINVDDSDIIAKTSSNIRTMIMESTRSALDPIYFAQNRMGVKLESNQIELVNAIVDYSIRNVASMQARQAGKSFSVATGLTICADKDVAHRKDRGTYIGVFANKEDQARLVRDKIMNLIENNPYFRSRMSWSECVKRQITWKSRADGGTGSIIKFLSASEQAHIEGETFDIIVLDESQKISDYVYEEGILPMGGACVCEGTLLMDDFGNMIPVESFTSKKIIGYKFPDAFVDDVVWFDKTGVKECYEITTNSGRKLRCSYDHPLLMKPRNSRRLTWIETAHIKVGEQVAILDKQDFFGNKTMFDPRLIGMLIGDGSYRKKGMVRYCSCDDELLKYVDKYNFKSYKSHITKKEKIFMDGVIPGLCGALRKLGIYGQVGIDKRLPNDIGQYSKDTLRELLGGLFDTDGSVMIEDNRRGKIELISCSQDLLWDVFYLLEKFGIHSRIYFKKKGSNGFGKNGCWILVISEKISIERFYDNISFLVNYKQEKLVELIDILKNHKSKRQKNIQGLYFERIKSIESIGLQTVYNLTAKQEHNYIANGVVTHNTNAKMIQIGTPRRKNHFYNAVASEGTNYYVIKHDWTQCPRLYLDGAVIVNSKMYSEKVLALMPFTLRKEYFPENPVVSYRGKTMHIWDVPLEGGKGMSMANFKTQYMLHWMSGVDTFLEKHEWEKLASGSFDILDSAVAGETYYAGIDCTGKMSEEEADDEESDNEAESHTSISIIRITPNGVAQKVFHKFLGLEMDWVAQGKYFVELFNAKTGKFPFVKKILVDLGAVGRPVVDYGREAKLPMDGIIFNAKEKDSQKNFKNAMYDKFQFAVQKGDFVYPSIVTDPKFNEKDTLLMNMRQAYFQWEDMEAHVPKGDNVNKKFKQGNAAKGDDGANSDVLAYFASFSKVKPKRVAPMLGKRL